MTELWKNLAARQHFHYTFYSFRSDVKIRLSLCDSEIIRLFYTNDVECKQMQSAYIN